MGPNRERNESCRICLHQVYDNIFNKFVTVKTDHKPLVTIFKTSLDKAPARFQNMLMKLQKYNLQVIYKCGKDMHLDDALSRVYIPGQKRPR